MANLDDGSISLDQFDFCSMSTVLSPDSVAVYNEVEAYHYDPDLPGLWSGPFVYFDNSRSWEKGEERGGHSSFYISLLASELDLSIFNSECYQNLCDYNICEDDEFCLEDWEKNWNSTWTYDGHKSYLCCESDNVCRLAGKNPSLIIYSTKFLSSVLLNTEQLKNK